MTIRRRRLFAGHEIRALRQRIGLSQGELAALLGISVPYLSQIESNDRPLTPTVTLALARNYPDQWGEISGLDEALVISASEAAGDTSISDSLLSEDDLRRAADHQPELTRRMIAIHHAYRQSQEQLRMLDDIVAANATDTSRLPWDEVRDWFHGQGNYIDSIDRRAETIAAEARPDARSLIERLTDAHGISVSFEEASGTYLRRYDADRRKLTIDRALPPESLAFLLANHVAQLEMRDLIDATIAGAGLRFKASRDLLTLGLVNYAAGAMLMPYMAFREAARAVRHDVDSLRHAFGVSFEQACHRLSTLQRPGASGIPMFFLRVDMAGNITKRHSATRLQFARFGGACPLWVVHEAVAIPDRILVQRADMPDGTRYVSMAKGLVKPSSSYSRRPRRYAVALGCEESDADNFVYADTVRGVTPTPIGMSCRICPRDDCDQRAFPPANTTLRIDPDMRSIVPYGFS
jgi:predicted transcriptional regulator/transcriptional regulator with XRE-family HTH domain